MHRGEPNNLNMKTATWSEHVEAWLTFPRLFLLKYEDLAADPRAALRAMTAVKTDVIDRAIAGATHERMKSMDPGVFMGPGVAGRWREALTQEGRRLAFEAFGETMTKVGYDVG